MLELSEDADLSSPDTIRKIFWRQPPEGLYAVVAAAAARDGVSVSAWMTIAAREALQRRAGLAAVDRWEKQHGRLTAEEMNEARRKVRAQLRTSRTIRRPA